jgi:hypothetical protein
MLTSLAGAKAAAAKLSHATIISIPGVGHFVSPRLLRPGGDRTFLADPAAPDTSPASAPLEAAALHSAGFALKRSKHNSRANAELCG